MTRRKILIAAVLGSMIVGTVAMTGLADHFAVFADDDDDEDQGTLPTALSAAKISLQQGLTASEQQGKADFGKI